MLDPTFSLLERYLDVLAARQRIAASNIANADTPGYRARDIDLHSEVRSLLDQPASFPAHLAVFATDSWMEPAKNDGNNVNLEREMKALSENVLRFTVASMLLQKEIRGMRNAIQEGRGA